MLTLGLGTAAAVVLVALIADALTGEPDALYRRVPHPVVLMGRLVGALERRLNVPDAPRGRRALLGLLTVAVVVGAATLAAGLLQRLLMALPGGWLWVGLALSSLIATRSLHDHVADVATGLRTGLDAGRATVARIVGRDPASLDAAGIGRAAIESCAEGFADGVVAPVVWALLFGLPGAAAYKALNTLDSMIGHRNERFAAFGRAAARADDATNFVPARLAGALLALGALLMPALDARAAWRIMARDARRHRSPNAGWPEAAMAGALGLKLAGPRSYDGATVEDAWLGDGRADPGAPDIVLALGLCTRATLVLGAGVVVLLLVG